MGDVGSRLTREMDGGGGSVENLAFKGGYLKEGRKERRMGSRDLIVFLNGVFFIN